VTDAQTLEIVDRVLWGHIGHQFVFMVANVPSIHIVDGREPHGLLHGLFSDQNTGITMVR
jgi:acetylglutamate kinase